MYKGLCKKAAAWPGLFVPESQKNKKDLGFIIFLKREEGKIVRHKKVFECKSGMEAKRQARSIYEKHQPDYIVAFHKYAYDRIRMVFEKGPRKLIEEWKGGKAIK